MNGIAYAIPFVFENYRIGMWFLSLKTAQSKI